MKTNFLSTLGDSEIDIGDVIIDNRPKSFIGYDTYGCGSINSMGVGYTPNTYISWPIYLNTKSWKSIGCGNSHSISISKDGMLWSWGSNTQGQLGVNDTLARSIPTRVGYDNDWYSVHAFGPSGQASAAIKDNGSLWTWGVNTHGVLGLIDESNRSSPTQVGSLLDWTTLAVGRYHMLSIKKDGTLWSWGYNNSYQLGSGNTINKSSPIQIGTDQTWIKVACNEQTSFGIKRDGTLWGWGNNSTGLMGIGSTTPASFSVPTQIGTLTDWDDISCGENHIIAKKVDGTIWSWGDNVDGQLGLNDTLSRSSPTQVGVSTSWVKVHSGFNSSFAIDTNGLLWTWGYNTTSGLLGLGDTTNRSIPTQNLNPGPWVSITSSGNVATIGTTLITTDKWIYQN